MSRWLWWVLSIVLGLRLTADIYASHTRRAAARKRLDVDDREAYWRNEFDKLRAQMSAPSLASAPGQHPPIIGAVMPDGTPMSQEAARAYWRSQGNSEIFGPGDGAPFVVALPAPVPLRPRSISGDEIRCHVKPLTPNVLGLMLALAGPLYNARKGSAPS